MATRRTSRKAATAPQKAQGSTDTGEDVETPETAAPAPSGTDAATEPAAEPAESKEWPPEDMESKDEPAPSGGPRVIKSTEELKGDVVKGRLKTDVDILREVYPPNTKTPSYVLVLRAGMDVPATTVIRG